MSATETMGLALIELTDHGQIPPCGGSSDQWLSEDHDQRAIACRCCQCCPLLEVCAAYAKEIHASFGVFGAHDYTPKPGGKSEPSTQGQDPPGERSGASRAHTRPRGSAVRLTGQLLQVEATVGEWLNAARGWAVWRDDATKRRTPAFLALYVPTGQLLAVHCRPRRLYPSEVPDASWLPSEVTVCVWWPALARDVRAWLGHPSGDPPGVVSAPRKASS